MTGVQTCALPISIINSEYDIYSGGIAGYATDIGIIVRSIVIIEVTTDNTGTGSNYSGAIIGGRNDNLYSNHSLIYADISGYGEHMLSGKGSIDKLNPTYIISGSLFHSSTDITYNSSLMEIVFADLQTTSFYTNNLGFNQEIWNFTEYFLDENSALEDMIFPTIN